MQALFVKFFTKSLFELKIGYGRELGDCLHFWQPDAMVPIG